MDMIKIELTKRNTALITGFSIILMAVAAGYSVGNGKHKGTNITPIVFENKKEGNFALCDCKKTGNPSYCDGAYLKKIKETLL